MTISPIQQAYNGLVICAMSKVCAHTSCMHRMTHLYGHGVCWAGIDRNGDVHTRLCSNFGTKSAFSAQTYLQNEKASFVKTKELLYGWCCSGMERNNGGYRTRGCYSPLYKEKALTKKKPDNTWTSYRMFSADEELSRLRREVWTREITERR
jgi:hypothetical protein